MATSASTGFIRVVRSTFQKLNILAEAMERTPYDDLADRVSRLERELTQLKKEGRRVK
jgi:polyhydroxyalkanoate synthesis regulator phasin